MVTKTIVTLLFCVFVFFANAGYAAPSSTVLAARAIKLYGATELSSEGERYFQITLILDEILEQYPKSMVALRIRKNKGAGVNVEEVRRVAEDWEIKFPEKALRIRDTLSLDQSDTSGFPLSQPSNNVTTPPAQSSSQEPGRPAPTQQKTDQNASVVAAKAATTASTPTKFRRGQRVEILTGATVLVVVLVKKNGTLQVGGHGTGFFINKTQILTNAHVARNAESFVIASQTLGIGQGTVAVFGQTKSGLGPDAAVIDVKGIEPIAPLDFSVDLLQGDTILMSGYPGVIGKTDESLGNLFAYINDHVKPSKKAVPSLRITDTGVIEAIFKKRGIDDLQYTMETTGGNSGSPVVNACAQVVGLHYFGVSDERNNSKYNFGHSAESVREFLDSNGIKYTVAPSPCEQG